MSIHQKLENFIRSYYKQQCVQGLVYTSVQALILFLLVNYTEYNFWLDSVYRGFLFYLLLIGVVGLFSYQVIWPLGKLYNAGVNRLSEEQAAKIIGSHFPEIADKLLNLLQLEHLGKENTSQSLLLIKGIEQKTKQLNPFQFTEALNWPSFRKSMYRFMAIILVLGAWGIYDATNLSHAANRLLQYHKEFEKPAPFDFIPSFQDTQIISNSDLAITLRVEGKTIPEMVYVQLGNRELLMEPVKPGYFAIKLTQVKESFQWKFKAGEVKSKSYQVQVIPKFQIDQLIAKVRYPAYLQRKSEELSLSDAWILPEGSVIDWQVNSKGANAMFAMINHGKTNQISNSKSGDFRYSISVKERGNVNFWTTGEGITSDTLTKEWTIVADAYPEIELDPTVKQDKEYRYILLGNATDDYGITKAFIEILRKDKGQPIQRMPITHFGGSSLLISEVIDWRKFGIEKGVAVDFRVGVVDNDAVNGGKTSYTQWISWQRWTDEILEKQLESGKDNMERQLADAQKQSKQLQKQSESLQNAMSFSPQLNLEMQEKVGDWIDKQQEQLEKLKNIRKEQEKLQQQQEEIAPKNQDLKERREALKERMQRTEDPKLQELMKELQELLSRKKSPTEIQQKMNQIERRMQQQQQEMDQLLEQLKELRLEEQIDLQGEKMQEWLDKQKELIQKTEALELLKKDAEAFQKENTALKEALENQKKEANSIEKRAEEILEQNKKLASPMKIDAGKKEINQAEQQEQEAQEQLNKGQSKKSQEKQQNAAQQMQEAMQQMQESLKKAQQERNSEDLKALRALLENLISVSHKQELVFTELAELNGENPRVRVLNKEQMNIKAMSQGMEDSLRALAKRQPMVSDLVTREIADINDNMDRAFEGLKVRNVRQAAAYEQYVMTGYNNLAVMLMESLKNVQQRMNQQSSSSPKNGKMCQNPKPGNSGKSQKGKGSKLSEQQKQLGEKLQEMQQAQQGKGNKKGKEGKESGEKGKEGKESGKNGKPGESGNPSEGENGKQGSSNGERLSDKEWVEMMLMQEQIRRKIEALRKEALKDGQTGQAANLFEAEKLMEEQERKWAQKQLDAQMIWRQQQIETRLLEHEKAHMKQRQDEQRQSKSPESVDLVIPPEWIEKQRQQLQEKEQLRKANPEWLPYYQRKSEEYLRKNS